MKESWPFCDCLKGTSMGEVTLANWPLVVILVSRDNRESTGLVFLGIVCVCVFVCFPAMVLWIVSQTILSCHILLMSQVSMILTILMLKNQEVWSRKVEISWFIFLLLSPPQSPLRCSAFDLRIPVEYEGQKANSHWHWGVNTPQWVSKWTPRYEYLNG